VQTPKPLAFAALGAVLAVAAYGNVPPPPGLKQPAPPAPPAVQAWEYKFLPLSYGNVGADEKTLNALGADGWQVIESVVTGTTAAGAGMSYDSRLVLRRPKR
jgi:hypothetical protein